MKRISMIMLSLATISLTAGCGKKHDERDARHDVKAAAHDAASDANQAFQDARQAARDLTHAAEAAATGAQTDVRQAAAELRDDLRSRGDGNWDHHDVDYNRPADPAELRDEAKRDAVNAVGAAAEEAAAKFLNGHR
jgi:signal transduction histidine kinase